MINKFKSTTEISNLAAAIKNQRLRLGYTLKSLEILLNINCGQLSRFENADFKTKSNNLQKYCNFLGICIVTNIREERTLGERFEEFASQSPEHHEAAEKIVDALQHLIKK